MGQVNIGMNLIDGVSVHLKRIQIQLTNTTRKLLTLGTASKTIQKGMGGMVGKMFLMAGVMMVAMKVLQSMSEAVTKSAEAFRNFEIRMAEVSTIVGDTEAHMDSLGAGVRGMSMKFGKSADDLARGLYDILSAAVPVEDSLHLLHIAAKAAAAGLTTVEKSVDVLTSVMNAYGKTVNQMHQVSDVMFKSVIRGKFRFEELASSLGYVTPIAAQVGISFEEIAAAISSATRQGQHVDMVARGLALTIQNIIKPSEGAREAAEKLGIDLSAAAIAAYGLQGFMEKLAIASNNNAANISKIVPNMRSYRVAMVLASSGSKEFGKDLDLMENALGNTNTAFSKISDTIDMQRNVLVQYKEEMLKLVGESTTGLEQLGIKWEMFTTSLVENWMSGFTGNKLSENPILRFLDAITLGIPGAVTTASEASKKADKVAQDYVSNQIEILKNGTKEIEPLFDQMMAGGSPDLALYDTLVGELDDIKQEAIEVGETLSRALDEKAPAWFIKELNENFQELNLEVTETEGKISFFKAGLDDALSFVENASNRIDTLATYMTELAEAITESKQKLAEMKLSMPLDYMSHWVGLLSEDISYQDELNSIIDAGADGYAWYTDEVADAISVINEYEKQTKEATDAQNAFNEALARNRIETMKIQLLGMMRRRGNTRAELRTLKQLNIERTEMQIEAAQNELDAQQETSEGAIDAGENAYNAAKALIDKMVRDQEHLLWTTQDTRAQDIDNLAENIKFKLETWDEYRDKVDEITVEMYEAQGIARGLLADLEAGYDAAKLAAIKEQTDAYLILNDVIANKITGLDENDPGTMQERAMNAARDGNIPAIVRLMNPGMADFLKERGVPGYARGTDYIGSDGAYNLHKGERVQSASDARNESNSSSESNVHIGNVIINVKSVEDISSPEKLAAMLSEAVDRRIISTSKPRARNKEVGNSYRVL